MSEPGESMQDGLQIAAEFTEGENVALSTASNPDTPFLKKCQSGLVSHEEAAVKIQAAQRMVGAKTRCDAIRVKRLKNVVNALSTASYIQDSHEVERKKSQIMDRKSLLSKVRRNKQKSDDALAFQHAHATSDHSMNSAHLKKLKAQKSKMIVKKGSFEHQKIFELSEASAYRARLLRQIKEKKPWTATNKFSICISCLIVLNAACLGAEADYASEYPAMFLALEHFFTLVFFVELLLHFYFTGPKLYFADKLNFLDFFLVTISVLDVWVVRQIGIDVDLRSVSIFRLLRLLRLARLLRLLRTFKELTLLVTGFLASVRTLGWALLFLSIMVYIFALFARHVMGNGGFEFDESFHDSHYLFGTVDRSMLTLFVCVTEGCGFDIVHPTVLQAPMLLVFWSIFIFSTTFGLLNLIVGCFCENAMISAAENEKEMLTKRHEKRVEILRHMKDCFNSMDTEGQGTISKAEFTVGIMENDKVHNALCNLGLAEEENLFETLDADKEGVITFDQFFEGVLLIMKGHESAKAKDLVATQLATSSINRRLRIVEQEIKNVKRIAKRIDERQQRVDESVAWQSQKSRDALVQDIRDAVVKDISGILSCNLAGHPSQSCGGAPCPALPPPNPTLPPPCFTLPCLGLGIPPSPSCNPPGSSHLK